MSMSEIASGLKACATKAELSKASPQRATGTADFTDPRAVTTIPLGKMSATEVARFAFTISGCASESSRGFSFLLTGNPSGNPSGGEAVDVFVTTVRPQDFSADGIAPYQFGSKTMPGTKEVVAVLKVMGLAGKGCDAATWTLSGTSNQGTLDLEGYDEQATPASSFDEKDTVLHIAADTVSVDVEIANVVLPLIKDAGDAARAAQGTADSNSVQIGAQAKATAANADSVALLGEDIELIQSEVESFASQIGEIPRSCKHLEASIGAAGSVRGVPVPGGTIRIECNRGYYLDGENGTIQCDGATGEYTPAAPSCTECDKGCMECTGSGLAADSCQECDRSGGYRWDKGAGACKPYACSIDAASNNLVREVRPSVDSICFSGAPHFLVPKFITDGVYLQPNVKGGNYRDSYGGEDKGFYHSCPGELGQEVRLTLRETAEVATVRVYVRCDCCADRILGVTVWAQDPESENWRQCEEAFGTPEDFKVLVAGRGGDTTRTSCDLSRAPEDQFLERNCGGTAASAVKIVQGGEAPLNIQEIEAYPC